IALSCCEEADTALVALAVAVWGSDLFCCGSAAAEDAVFGKGRAAAAPSLCADGHIAAVSLPSDPDAGLSGTSLHDKDGRAAKSFWVKAVVFSLTGPRTLLATVASWDTTLSTVLSGGGTGELAAELEPEVDEGDTLRLAAAAAQSLRLSASFFSLGIPGEEQEGRVSWLSAVKLSVVLMVVGLESLESVMLRELVVIVTVVVEGTAVLVLTRVCSSDLGSDGAAFTMGLFKSDGGAGLRKVSLLTEMNALPGMRQTSGPLLPEGRRTVQASSLKRRVGERQRDGRVPPGPVLTVVGLSRGGGVKVVPLRPSWLSSEPSSVSSSEESTSWMASCFCSDSLLSALSCRMADSLSFSLLFPGARPSEPDTELRELSPSWRPNFLDEEECFCRLPFSTPHAPPAVTPEGDEGELARDEASFSADCTLLRSGERGGSALLGLDICLTRGGEEWSFTGND
ncbi:hypothetical protein NQZ68_022577, partial [Dissostichus eleginoides]